MVRILGIRVDEYDMQQSLERIEAFVAAGNAQPKQVVTLNPEGVWLARADKRLAEVIEQAALVTADGNGLLWAARQLGQPLPQRVTGIDLVQQIAAIAARRGWRLFLLGAAPGIAEQAAARLEQDFPGLNIVGCENGYFREREAEVVAKVRAAQADVLFCALGMPYQELWLHQHGAELGCALMVGVGGSFDVLAGQVKRAPRVWQRLKLEWLWRLVQEPKRWRRALIIPKFMLAVKREAAKL